jgi:Mg-chelatase subunit ChlD
MSKTLFRAVILIVIVLLKAQSAAAQTDVMIAVDLSRSMKVSDPSGYRFAGAEQLLTMVSLSGDNRAGIVLFGNDAREFLPLQKASFDNPDQYKNKLNVLPDEDWTELGKGLDLCRTALGSSTRKKSIIIISDGIIEGNPRTRNTSIDAAREQAERELWTKIVPALMSAGIRVYTIGLFQGPGSVGEKLLQKIANDTLGSYDHVDSPGQFSLIYRRLFNDIYEPSGVVPLNDQSRGLTLTPADDALLIIGQKGFLIIGPDGTVYGPDKGQVPSPVRQKPYIYSDNNAILFLGRPDSAQDASRWVGRWVVQGIQGEGQATYLSTLRFIDNPDIPMRNEYFLNEFIPIRLQLALQAKEDFDPQEFLKRCSVEYTIVYMGQDPTPPPPKSGSLTREGSGGVFKGEQLIERDGNYRLEVRLLYKDDQNSGLYRTFSRRFYVSRTQLLDLWLDPDSRKTVGDRFVIVGRQNPQAFTSDREEFKGLQKDKLIVSLRYGSDEPSLVLKDIHRNQGDLYLTKPVSIDETGDLTIEGILEGELVLNQTDDSHSGLKYYPVKVQAATTIRGIRYTTLGQAKRYVLDGFTVLGFLLAGFLFIRHRQWRKMESPRLTGDKSFGKVMRGKPSLGRRMLRHALTIGGLESNADYRLEEDDGKEIFAELGVDAFMNYFVKQVGQRSISVGAKPLGPNGEVKIKPNEMIRIQGVGTFKFTV